jgi:hypothetical protein
VPEPVPSVTEDPAVPIRSHPLRYLSQSSQAVSSMQASEKFLPPSIFRILKVYNSTQLLNIYAEIESKNYFKFKATISATGTGTGTVSVNYIFLADLFLFRKNIRFFVSFD